MPYSIKRNRFYPSLVEEPWKFWEKVDTSGGTEACWPWTGCCNDKGYGRAGKRGYAHRIAYELASDGIPADCEILHACDNPPCCNPAHLSVGTREDNMQDAVAKGRHFTPFRRPPIIDVALARELRESGLSYRAIGRRFGVTHGCVSDTLRRTAA